MLHRRGSANVSRAERNERFREEIGSQRNLRNDNDSDRIEVDMIRVDLNR